MVSNAPRSKNSAQDFERDRADSAIRHILLFVRHFICLLIAQQIGGF